MSNPHSTTATSFGQRFVEEIGRLSSGGIEFAPQVLNELQGADRERLIGLIVYRYPMTSHASIQRVRESASPEALARESYRDGRGGRLVCAAWFPALTTLDDFE